MYFLGQDKAQQALCWAGRDRTALLWYTWGARRSAKGVPIRGKPAYRKQLWISRVLAWKWPASAICSTSKSMSENLTFHLCFGYICQEHSSHLLERSSDDLSSSNVIIKPWPLPWQESEVKPIGNCSRLLELFKGCKSLQHLQINGNITLLPSHCQSQ